jgi:hypothetical protein
VGWATVSCCQTNITICQASSHGVLIPQLRLLLITIRFLVVYYFMDIFDSKVFSSHFHNNDRIH